MNPKKILLSLLLLVMTASVSFGQKTLKLVHNGAYWGRVEVSYTERGQRKYYDSDKGIGKGWTHTIIMSDDVSNIVATVSTNRGLGIYGEGCKKNLGSSGGTFTFGGPIYSESCEWKPTDVSGGNGRVTSAANVNEILPGGNTHLHNAVRASETSEVKSLIRSGISHMETKNAKGFTPLHEATQSKNGEMVDLLLQNGANVMATNNQGNTPLYMAVNLGDKEMAEKLISGGHNMNAASRELERAITKRDAEMVRVFLDHNISADAVADMALKKNNIELVELALDEYGATPTIALYKKAVDSRKFDLAESLIDKNIDPNQALD
ncbi:MAG: ankyrin repeat domain-containing protein, partial [Bacteroidota bacterium]